MSGHSLLLSKGHSKWTTEVTNVVQTMQDVTRRDHGSNVKPRVTGGRATHPGTWGSRGREFESPQPDSNTTTGSPAIAGDPVLFSAGSRRAGPTIGP